MLTHYQKEIDYEYNIAQSIFWSLLKKDLSEGKMFSSLVEF